MYDNLELGPPKKTFVFYKKLVTLLCPINIHIDNCRNQSYDNGSNMSVQHNGPHAKITEIKLSSSDIFIKNVGNYHDKPIF